MAEKLDPKELVTFEELLLSSMYTQEALVSVLIPRTPEFMLRLVPLPQKGGVSATPTPHITHQI